MTGMGSDGLCGLRLLRRRGARIIAQDRDSCVVFGMPRLPIEEGLADEVVPLAEIAAAIVRQTGRGAPLCR
jgi:two-component system chemotaxis response regulator CheB